MLSNVELLLLKFISDKPSYAYELERMIDEKGIRRWVKVGNATVYQVLDRLRRQGLLEFTVEKEGNMPQRRRYNLTPMAEGLLKDSVVNLLSSPESYYFDLTVGLACRSYLNKPEFHEAIETRLEQLSAFIEGFNERFERSRELYPDKKHLVREYLLSHYKLEQEFLQKLLKESDI